MLFRPQASSGPQRQGFVLLAVLVVIVLLTLAAYQFSELMIAEYQAADSHLRAVQARALADSGVHYAAALLSDPDALTSVLNGNPYDNPGVFQGHLVQDNDKARFRGRFSIVAPLDPDDPSAGSGSFRYGVLDESGKINLNALLQLDSSGQVAHDMLLQLPNMTEDVANAILDWIDPDDEPRSGGAENDYYQTLPQPYRCKNGPLDTLEELLLVKGVTADLLFGNDTNRNGQLDPDESNTNGGLVDRGWSAYLTVHSRERNVDSQGNPRIYVNDSDLDTLYSTLSNAVGPDLASYIIAYRMYGSGSSGSGGGTGAAGGAPAAGGGTAAPLKGTSAMPTAAVAPTPTPAAGASAAGSDAKGSTPTGASAAKGASPAGQPKLSRSAIGNLQQGRPQRIASLYALINSSVSIPNSSGGSGASGGASTSTSYPSPLNDPGSLQQLLPTLLDKVTTVKSAEVPARININTAPRAVLQTLPGSDGNRLSDADVQSILDNRPSTSSSDAPDPIYQTPAWLITQANFTPDKLRTLEKYITARSQVYRVQVLGYFDGGGPTARIEAVIDANTKRPRIVYWRDLTELGKGFNLPNSQ